ncbi:MAG: SDR family oxidoreductase [Lachnospiraceae bacterium]|nr:SDR family oxidoreductase [Lachnospiraceae bacterium]
MNTETILDRFLIKDRVCVITGGAGLLGDSHARAVIDGGGIPVLLDISTERLEEEKSRLLNDYPDQKVEIYLANITKRDELEEVCKKLVEKYGHVDILINNAANNPKVEGNSKNMGPLRFDNLPMEIWNDDIAVGLTGAFLCSQVFGKQMEKQGKGVILNISSDLGVIAPDQRIYKKEGVPDDEQSVKPVTYSVIKHGLIGLTKYLATYWAEKGIRCNAICPAGVENGQDPKFVEKLVNLVPMGRMAHKDEYQGTVLYLISDASAYMTGSTVIIDGGRTCW